MRRIIEFSVMEEKAIKLKQQLEELKQEKNQLLADINKINESYKGVDATSIIELYHNKVKDIDRFITMMEKYQICFEWLSGSYRDSHNKAKNAIEFLETSSPIDTNIINLESININN